MNESPNFNTILIHQNDDGNSKNVRYPQPKSLAKDNKHKKYTMGMKLLCTCTTYKHVSSILYIISKDRRKEKNKKRKDAWEEVVNLLCNTGRHRHFVFQLSLKSFCCLNIHGITKCGILRCVHKHAAMCRKNYVFDLRQDLNLIGDTCNTLFC